MSKNLRVGNLGVAIDSEKLSEIFSTVGLVGKSRIVADQYSGISRGFGFVEMSTEKEAIACVEKLNGSEHFGRTLSVAEAPPEKAKRGGARKVAAK